MRDLDAARAFYAASLGFSVDELNAEEGWVAMSRGRSRVGLALGDPDPEASVVVIDVDDARAERKRLADEGVEVGTVLELHDEVRLVDVFDADGNRLQLMEELRSES